MPNKLTLLDKIIPAYSSRARSMALENELRLKKSGLMTTNEIAAQKQNLINAYGSARMVPPAIRMGASDLASFLRDKRYKNLAESGHSNGAEENGARYQYSNRVYGYPELQQAEKYGYVPLEDTPAASAAYLNKVNFYHPASAYGDVVLHLKPEVRERSTMSPFDSDRQWGSPTHRAMSEYGSLYPIPYDMDDPEEFIGGFLEPPTSTEEEAVADNLWEPTFLSYRRDAIRGRNQRILDLLNAQDPSEYVEAHVHGDISPEDIESIELDPQTAASSMELDRFLGFDDFFPDDYDAVQNLIYDRAAPYNIKFYTPEEYRQRRK